MLLLKRSSYSKQLKFRKRRRMTSLSKKRKKKRAKIWTYINLKARKLRRLSSLEAWKLVI